MTDAPTSRTLQGPLSYLSALHRLSPVEGVTTPASGTPHPRPPLAHWPACQRAGAGLRKSFGGPRPEGQSQGPEQTKIPWSRGPGTGVLSHPAAAAGRRLTGNRKMCTSHCWNTQRDLRRKGEGGGRRRPASCPRGGGPQGVLLRTPHPLAEPRVLPARGWNPAKCAHTSGLGLWAGPYREHQRPHPRLLWARTPPLPPQEQTHSLGPCVHREPIASSGRNPASSSPFRLEPSVCPKVPAWAPG